MLDIQDEHMMGKGGKKRKIMKRCGLILSAAGVISMVSAWPFFYFITRAGKEEKKEKVIPDPNRKKWFRLKHTELNHPKNGYEEEYEAGKAWCYSQPMEDLYLQSEDGLKLHASFLPAEGKTERIVIMCHGYRGTRFGTVACIAPFLHENHSDILFIDQRCCGESEGKYITFGAKEHKDLLGWIKKLNDQNEKHLPIYLYGQSMGGATVLLAAGNELPPEVHGLISDCSFHSMKQQMKDIASGWFHLHWIEFLLLRMDLLCRIFADFRMKDTMTDKALSVNTRPVLFFHGEKDTYVWPENSGVNFWLCKAPKELVLIPGARHSCSAYVAPDLYQKKMKDFFMKYDKSSV